LERRRASSHTWQLDGSGRSILLAEILCLATDGREVTVVDPERSGCAQTRADPVDLLRDRPTLLLERGHVEAAELPADGG